MCDQGYKGVLLSDFNVGNLIGYFCNDKGDPAVERIIVPQGQVIASLLKEDLECWHGDTDFCVVWTRPQAVINSFQKCLSYQSVLLDDILREVDTFCSLLREVSDRVKWVFVPTWTVSTHHRGLGMLDAKNGQGISYVLSRMNLRLSQNLQNTENLYILDAQRWVSLAGAGAFSPKLWYMGKIPFGNQVFKEAVSDVKAALHGLSGNARKLIILDLDNTLWGGIVGDDGWENLRLGGHDPIGEALVDFQREIKHLTNRGILLGLVSKNEESVALNAIRKHPEMLLRLEDFVGWRINWMDKAQNIIDLVSELNLGLQSVVFIDDNPVERARVKDVLPEVMVPEWPEDKMLYPKTLLGLRCFDSPSVTAEDHARTNMYAENHQRGALKKSARSLDDWLGDLDTRVQVEELNQANLKRTVQLLNKTNQMNLRTRRFTEQELMYWLSTGLRKMWTFNVSDKFGNSGLTGVLSFEEEHPRGIIADYVLSCRVMGRKIEDTMIYVSIQYARSVGLDHVIAEYVQTHKNGPCLEFFKGTDFVFNANEGCFVWDLTRDFPLPSCIKIEGAYGSEMA